MIFVITVSFQMLCSSVLVSFVFGVICALIYSAIPCVLRILLRLVSRRRSDTDSSVTRSRVHFGIVDFLFFLIVGITFIFINYAFVDGALTLYPLFSFAFAFVLVDRLANFVSKKHRSD